MLQALSCLLVGEVICPELGGLFKLMKCQSILGHVCARFKLLLVEIERLHVLLVRFLLESTNHVRLVPLLEHGDLVFKLLWRRN